MSDLNVKKAESGYSTAGASSANNTNKSKKVQNTNSNTTNNNTSNATAEGKLQDTSTLVDDTSTSSAAKSSSAASTTSATSSSSTSKSSSASKTSSSSNSSNSSKKTNSDLPKIGEKSEDEVETKVELKSGSNLPTSLKFGPNISITDIETGDSKGKYFSKMTMDGKTYSSTKVSTNHNGTETYIMEPDPKDGTKIVVERDADGTQYYRVYDTSSKAISELHLNKEGEARSLFRYKDGLAYEREYNDGLVRRYERDENNKLVSSMDYQRDKDGNINEDRPLSKQTYEYLDEIGAQWSSRVVYEYDDDGNQSIKNTEKYDYDQVKDENGEWTGEMTVTKNVYKGDSTDEDDLDYTEIMKYIEGILQSSEKKEAGKTTTYDAATGTTTIIETDENGDEIKKTVIDADGNKTVYEKDSNGEWQEVESEEADGEETESADEADSATGTQGSGKEEPKVDPESAMSLLKSKGYSEDEAGKIARAIFGDKSDESSKKTQVKPDDAIKKLTEGGYSDSKAQEIVKIIFGDKGTEASE